MVFVTNCWFNQVRVSQHVTFSRTPPPRTQPQPPTVKHNDSSPSINNWVSDRTQWLQQKSIKRLRKEKWDEQVQRTFLDVSVLHYILFCAVSQLFIFFIFFKGTFKQLQPFIPHCLPQAKFNWKSLPCQICAHVRFIITAAASSGNGSGSQNCPSN